jgi:hypothetical protein
VIAVAEEVAAMATEEVFAERRARADLAEFDRILNRQGGEPPRPGDELPPDLARLGPLRRALICPTRLAQPDSGAPATPLREGRGRGGRPRSRG